MFNWLPEKNYGTGYARLGIGLAILVGLTTLGYGIVESLGKNPNPLGLSIPRLPSMWELSQDLIPTTLEGGWKILGAWIAIGIFFVAIIVATIMLIALAILAIHLLAGLIGGSTKNKALSPKKAEQRY